ncbi:MAG: GntR family transcriptional regulator [bacterium]|nr:GntR family transcriptional regulator [bacterium]
MRHVVLPPATHDATHDATLSQRSLAYLRDLIVAGRIDSTRWMRMADLARALGTSITPVRSALMELEREGLVEIAKARGVRVIPMTREDVRDVYLLHAFLSGELAARAAARALPPLLEACRRLQRRMERVAAGRSKESIDDLNWKFHRLINLEAGAPRLARILRQVSYSVPHAFHAMVPGWSHLAMQHHRALIGALESGSAQEARNWAEEHVRVGCALLLEQLERSGSLGRAGAFDLIPQHLST